MITKNLLYFSDNRPEPHLLTMVHKQLASVGIPIISVTLKPMNFGKNIVLPLERGWGTYFKQILAGLEASDADIVYFVEHDCIYHPSNFEFTPPDKNKFYYNQNWVKIDWPYTKAVAWDADQVSGLVCYRELALKWYREKVASYNAEGFDRKFEPGSGTEQAEFWRSTEPYVDIRQEKVATKNKWSLADFRDKSTAKNFRETKCPKWAEDVIMLAK